MISTNHQAQLKEIISSALRAGASDLHLSVGTMPTARIDHQLKILNKDIILTTEFVQESASYLARLDDKEIKESTEMSFALTFETGIRFKVNIFYQKGLPAVSIRFIPQQLKRLDQLGLPAIANSFTELKRGLVVIAGPYGSGKSTTLSAFIQEINTKRHEYIMTLEQPIEYIFTSSLSIVEQREIGQDSPSFLQALDYLRQEDVDILMISKLPNAEVIMSILEIANSGVLVFAESDADSATSVIDKLISNFEGQKQQLVRRLLSDVLEGVLVQRLVPQIGGGQIPVIELLIATDPIRLAIKDGNTQQIRNILITSAKSGMINLDRNLYDFVKKQKITAEDALKQAIDPDTLEKMLKRT